MERSRQEILHRQSNRPSSAVLHGQGQRNETKLEGEVERSHKHHPGSAVSRVHYRCQTIQHRQQPLEQVSSTSLDQGHRDVKLATDFARQVTCSCHSIGQGRTSRLKNSTGIGKAMTRKLKLAKRHVLVTGL